MRACGFSTWNLGEVQVLGKEPCSGLRHYQWGMSQWICRLGWGLDPCDLRDLRREGRVVEGSRAAVAQVLTAMGGKGGPVCTSAFSPCLSLAQISLPLHCPHSMTLLATCPQCLLR